MPQISNNLAGLIIVIIAAILIAVFRGNKPGAFSGFLFAVMVVAAVLAVIAWAVDGLTL